ncbi:ClpP protease-like protein [Anaerobacterium chartisolvens]|uniref:ATP-dependent Clp protease proteolytic subunit n=1 Tax=Anaerobacterium chartisolvens TaxID=1297424 RepID=A0A369BJW3_9FIRM|nr:head maturation protease, ClpP-related [Anaerobacterium chartisolvens]RCX20888.1 ClpP protease-like protein [Anaerobacterium chartisolvens]
MPKFWSFKNIAADQGEEEIELRIEGEITDDDYAWLYEWFGISAALPNAFREELAQYKGKNITVWINSYGGSVFAAAGMYNALMEHKKTGAKIITKSDSKVMSAATIPYMVGDERFMGPVDIFMMHNPLTEVYGYASDLRKAADVLDEIKETIINAYQLGTGRSRAKISAMMDDETYMSARTAVKEGFATDMLYGDKQQASPAEEVMNLGYRRILAIQNSANESIKKFFELPDVKLSAKQEEAPKPNPDANKTNNSEGNDLMPPKNIEELKNTYPDMVKQVEDAAREEGAKNERQRIQDIEKIAKNMVPELVNKAKFEEPIDARELAFKALQDDAGKGQQYLNNALKDAKDSGAGDVTAQPNTQQTEQGKKEAEDKAAEGTANAINKRRGIK